MPITKKWPKRVKDVKPLEPVDEEQCQAEMSNGVNFMTLGGRREMVRCKNRPTVIATECRPDEHGRRGAMSLCEKCSLVLQREMGPNTVTIKPITPKLAYALKVRNVEVYKHKGWLWAASDTGTCQLHEWWLRHLEANKEKADKFKLSWAKVSGWEVRQVIVRRKKGKEVAMK